MSQGLRDLVDQRLANAEGATAAPRGRRTEERKHAHELEALDGETNE